MDLISKTAETDRLNPLVFKKREGLLELLPMHTQSAMASRAAMTVYGIASRIVQKVFVGYIKSWTKESLKERLKRHYNFASNFYTTNDPNINSNNEKKRITHFMLTNIIDFLNNKNNNIQNRYGNRRLYVDDLNSSLAFVKKVAAMSTTIKERNDLDDNFIRQWLLKADIPRFKLEYDYEEQTRRLTISLKQLDGSTYEGEIFIQIYQDDGKRDIISRNISADVDSDWKIQTTKSKTNYGSKTRHVNGGIRGSLKYILFDPKMQLIHTMVGVKYVNHPTCALLTEILFASSKSANPGTKIDSINKLKYLPDTVKVCTVENDIQPCKSLVQTLNPLQPFDMAIRCHAVEAISTWQNLHAPLSYMDNNNSSRQLETDGNHNKSTNFSSTSDSTTTRPTSYNSGNRYNVSFNESRSTFISDLCGGWTPGKLWTTSSPYGSVNSTVRSSISNSKNKKGGGASNIIVDNAKTTLGTKNKQYGNNNNNGNNNNASTVVKQKNADPWYGLHALMTVLRAYFYNNNGDVAIPSYMHPPEFYVFRIKLIEAISSIRDQNGLPPITIRKIMGELLDNALDSKDSRANFLYVAALLRALGRTSTTEDEVKETMLIYNQFLQFQNIMPAPRDAIMVACLRGIADLESSFSKTDTKFPFHSYALVNPSSRVRIAAIESILRIYLASGQGDGLKTIEWILTRMLRKDACFETSGAVRSVVLLMLRRVIDQGMADETLKLQLLSPSAVSSGIVVGGDHAEDSTFKVDVGPHTNSYKSFVSKLWYALNSSSWYDWNIRQSLFKLYKSFFSYETPEPFESIVEPRHSDVIFANPMSVPSSNVNDDIGNSKRKRRCLVDRIKPQNKQYGMEYDTPMLSPRRSSSGSIDNSLNEDLFSLDGNNGNGMSNANNSNAIDTNINVSRSLVINASSSMGVSTNSGVEGEGSLLTGDIMPSFVSGAKTGKERRKSTKLKFKRKRK